MNLRPGVWLPSYIYSEESDMDTSSGKVHLKAQTRLWGYDLRALAKNRNEEFAQIMVDPQEPVRDQSAVARTRAGGCRAHVGAAGRR